MLWRVQYKKAMGLVRGTATEIDRDAAIERALKLHNRGYEVISVGTDVAPKIFNAPDIQRLFALQREQ
jgi:hypothetical protein